VTLHLHLYRFQGCCMCHVTILGSDGEAI
jgi:hypothetical protein